MAFTVPKTWAFQEGVESAELNTHLRDNFLAMGPHLIVRKASDQSVTSSTAFVSDTALTMSVGISEVWLFRFHLRYEASAAGDIKIAFSLPASGQIDATANLPIGTTGSFQDATWQTITATDANPLGFAGAGAGLARTQVIDGTYIGGGTAGSVTLRWAQNTSDGTATKVLTHSTLWGVQLV
jgi:hypothetical protein